MIRSCPLPESTLASPWRRRDSHEVRPPLAVPPGPLLAIVEAIRAKGAGFRSLAEDIDTTTSAGRLIFHVFASIAQFERERIAERTREGLVAARKAGRIGGRPPALSKQQRDEVRRLRDEEGRRTAEIARLFNVSPNTVRRA
ncbi:recombinase family protein [Paracoccus jeotgali]|uniref:recombinase family protein n=1 Tax=Paracoccus jeotgali TaxID=2065379 RepID=UPI0028AE0E2F|nr:recombinase family protein [Paracoccus jeotgali]